MTRTGFTAPYTDPQGTWRMADGTAFVNQARAAEDSVFRDLVNRLRTERVALQGEPAEDGQPYEAAGRWYLGDGHPIDPASPLHASELLRHEANVLRLAFNVGREEREASQLLADRTQSVSDDQVRALIAIN